MFCLLSINSIHSVFSYYIIQPILNVAVICVGYGIWEYLILLNVSLFTKPTVGKDWAGKLEEDVRSCRNCKYTYSLLAGAAAR